MKTADKFIIHYVAPTEESIDFDIHTHGLKEEFGHKELQLTLPLQQRDAGLILNILANEIEKGMKLEPHIIYKEPFPAEYKCVPLYNVETGNESNTLRLVLSDKNGFFPEDENCNEDFKHQYNTVGDLTAHIN